MYDVIIVGGGPAGLSAGIYASRARLSALILERAQDGGQIAMTDSIENYPGQMLEGESGTSLSERMSLQAKSFGCEKVQDEILKMELDGDVKRLHGRQTVYEARTVILALGTRPRPIGCEGEEAFRGRGISYCATCDANFFEGLPVYVVGGGDAAVEEAMYLTKFASHVTVIHRRDELRAVKAIQEKAFQNEKLSFLLDSVVVKAEGEDLLSKITVQNKKTGELTVLEAGDGEDMIGLFGFVGQLPCTELLKDTGLALNEQGYLIADEEMRTNIPGVYAAGDVRVKSLRQVVTAVADGAIAAVQAGKYIEEL